MFKIKYVSVENKGELRMNSSYDKEITDLGLWFKEKLAGYNQFSISKNDIGKDVRKLPEPIPQLSQEAFDYWCNERKYEPSYNQMQIAVFWAIKELGKVS